ncbi:Hypothetical protein LUCI_3229 [Lucifera butyrica]|uniref:Uncharacterized protein n=1 Tax=Lucifera butyrica TaxID=1351585 RepID=A0A498R8W4_9FIRM|nr:hypothetical protein [Lucifera butyrica]VBB07964.1 Hypothetical protein LUCI_3229 [Lucifera butyrica]
MQNSNGKWFIRGEQLVLRLCIVFIGLLLITQALELKEQTRRYFSLVDRLEGQSVALDLPSYNKAPMVFTERPVTGNVNPQRAGQRITISLLGPSPGGEAYISINGENLAELSGEGVTIAVYGGDYLEIDATRVKKPLTAIVHTNGQAVLFPPDGLVVEGRNSKLPIGKIKLRR